MAKVENVLPEGYFPGNQTFQNREVNKWLNLLYNLSIRPSVSDYLYF